MSIWKTCCNVNNFNFIIPPKTRYIGVTHQSGVGRSVGHWALVLQELYALCQSSMCIIKHFMWQSSWFPIILHSYLWLYVYQNHLFSDMCALPIWLWDNGWTDVAAVWNVGASEFTFLIVFFLIGCICRSQGQKEIRIN